MEVMVYGYVSFVTFKRTFNIYVLKLVVDRCFVSRLTTGIFDRL